MDRSGHRPTSHRVSPSSLSSTRRRRTLRSLLSPPPGLPIDGYSDRRSGPGPRRLRSPNLHPDSEAPFLISTRRRSPGTGGSIGPRSASPTYRNGRRRSIPALWVLAAHDRRESLKAKVFGTSDFLSRFSRPSRLSQALPTVPAASVTDADEDNGRRSRRMLKRFVQQGRSERRSGGVPSGVR